MNDIFKEHPGWSVLVIFLVLIFLDSSIQNICQAIAHNCK